MGLFPNPCEEVSEGQALENAKPRKGFSGLFLTAGDYTLELVRANLIVTASLIPAALLYYAAMKLTGRVLAVTLASMLGSFPLGASLVALFAVVIKSVRNGGYRFNAVFGRHFRENLIKGLLPGALYILSLCLTAYLLLFSGAISALRNPRAVRTMLVLLIVAIRMLLSYMLPLMALVDLPVKHYLRNSLLLMAAKPKATLGAAVTSGILYVLTVLFVPATLAYVLLIGFSLDALVSALWCWPAVNEALRIEEREEEKKIKEKQNENAD